MNEWLAEWSASRHSLVLDYRPPFDWASLRGFFAARAIDGLEIVEGERYVRTVVLDGTHGILAVAPAAGGDALVAMIASADAANVPAAAARLRSMFDLDADVATVARYLRDDPLLAPLVAARPGLRVPGAWDPFEVAVRAVLGQQVTVRAARTLAGRLVAELGEPLAADVDPPVAGLRAVFPRPSQLTDVERIGRLGMPRARARTIVALASAVAADPTLLSLRPDRAETIGRLRAVPGIGDWTAEYIALRALRDPDAFPAGDVGLLRAAGSASGRRPSAEELRQRSLTWRPWRAYAAQHLWSAGVDEVRTAARASHIPPGSIMEP